MMLEEPDQYSSMNDTFNLADAFHKPHPQTLICPITAYEKVTLACPAKSLAYNEHFL